MTGTARREEVLRRALVELSEARSRADALERTRREPIAIVGAGCRFPGADGPDGLWRLLCEGRDAIREVPADRWDVDALYDPDASAPGKTYTRHGGFIDDVDGFDARFFGIPPREAASMDPQHRLVLEVAWSALEHAGIAPDSLRASSAGVYVGMTAADYAHVAAKTGDPAAIDAYLSTGNVANFASGRLSYLLGLEGPSIALDTACSSSLVTTHLACSGLRSGECDLALAGGVNLMLLPETTVALAKARMLSPDGRCKTFDAAADGYVRGEGCGMLVLKRLGDAETAGDEILAVIRGSAINQDGRSSGATVPYAAAQEAVVRRALAAAGIEPAAVDYVEAHGTGTPLGDPIELRALGRALTHGRERPALIGSVKTNIGHLESAAGVAGLIKAALALAHGKVPPHLHMCDPTPHVDWDTLPLKVTTEATALPDGPRIAGVSSFGISGTNAHVVLESGAAAASVPALAVATEPDRPVVIKLSARGEAPLAESAAQLRDYVAEQPASVAAIARAACTGRADLPDRAAVVATTCDELVERLGVIADGGVLPGVWRGRSPTGTRPKVAFLVAGQGSRYGGALAGMRGQPAVDRALDELAEVLGPLDRLPLAPLLEPGAESDRALASTATAQPALYALALALAAWWRHAGVRPDVVTGHSVGAYAAAALAGVFSPQDGAQLVAERGNLMGELPTGGTMAAVMAGAEAVADAIAGAPALSLACLNSAEETVVAGSQGDVERICAELADRRVRTRMLAVSHAFHSPLIEPALPGLERALAKIALQPPTTTLVSDTTGAPVTRDVTDPAYWLRHAREPVDFTATVGALAELGCRQLVELGPADTLLALASRHPATAGTTLLPSREPEASLSRAWVGGTPVDWRGASPAAACGVRLPTYPFQHSRHWIAAGPAARHTGAPAPRGLVPQPIDTALAHDLYSADLTFDSAAVLREHRVYGHAVVPGVVYLELILAAAEQSGVEQPAIDSLSIGAALTLHDGERRELQVVLEPADGRVRRVGVHSRHNGTWRLQAEATVSTTEPIAASDPLPLEAVRSRCAEELDGEAFYKDVWHPRFELGPRFRLVDWVARRDGEALALLHAPAPGDDGPRSDLLTLDACVQALVATLPRSELEGVDRPLALGTGHRRLTVHRALPPGRVWCWATLVEDADGGLTGDVRAFDEDGEPVASVGGISFRRIGGETLRRLADATRPGGATESSGARELTDRLRSAGSDDRPGLVLGYLATALSTILGMPASEIESDQPIVSLADSLMLVELKTRIETDLDLELPVDALFEQPRLHDLAAWLAGRLDTDGAKGSEARPTMAVAELRAKAELDPAITPRGCARRGRPRAVLLTGATGFLGAFLLDELLSRTHADVHCLVRAPTTAGGLDRIAANLESYGLRREALGARVVPVLGDLEQPLIGLDRHAFDALAGGIGAIYHCGAQVKWTYPYAALARANVDGTREILRLATARTPLPVHFVSTVGVFSSAEFDGRAVAEDADIERIGRLAVGYAQSKWVAEHMVRAAAGRGLPMTIHRPSIGADSRTGAFNRHDHVALAISGCVQIGCAPESDMPVQIAPVDFVAGALVELSLSDGSAGGTFHLVNPDSLTWSELWDVVAACGYPLRTLPLDEWRAALADRPSDGAANLLDGLLPFLTGSLEHSSLPRFECTRTYAALEPAGIDCPRLDAHLIGTYLDGLVAGGFLEPRRAGATGGLMTTGQSVEHTERRGDRVRSPPRTELSRQ